MPTDKQRRQNERRRLQRQLERRRERDERRRRVIMIISVVGTVLVIGLVLGLVFGLSGGSSKHPAAAAASRTSSSSPTAPASSSSSATEAAYPCTWTKSGTAARKVSVPPTTTPPRSGTVRYTLDTNRGALTFALNRTNAPCAVESFVSLAKQKYFDDTICHRLTTEGIFVLQCGDPTGTGSGGPGYSFADELSGKEKYTRGVLAMANAGANTNGSQFFIVYKQSQLPPKYTVFGTVTKGLGIVDKVAAAGTTTGGTDGKPKLGVTLKTVRPA